MLAKDESGCGVHFSLAFGQLWVSCRSAVAVAVGLTVVTAVVVTEICRSDVGRTIAVVAAYSSYTVCIVDMLLLLLSETLPMLLE